MNDATESGGSILAWIAQTGSALLGHLTESAACIAAWVEHALASAEADTVATFGTLGILWALMVVSAVAVRLTDALRRSRQDIIPAHIVVPDEPGILPAADPKPRLDAPRSRQAHGVLARLSPAQSKALRQSGAAMEHPPERRVSAATTARSTAVARPGVIGIRPLAAETPTARDKAAAQDLTKDLRAVLGQVAPHLSQVVLAPTFQPKARPPKATTRSEYLLTGHVRLMPDRLRVIAELRCARTLESVFRFRYQALPAERDKILAEIAMLILKHSCR